MKSRKILSILLALTLLAACDPPVTFMEPQPPDTDNITSIPKRLRGQYISLDDQSTLIVEDQIIQRVYELEYKMHTNQMDEDSRLSGDTLINTRTKEKKVFTRKGDSLIIHTYNIDTMFRMDYDNVMRKYKGYYFLNTRHGKESWKVQKMQLSKGQLNISSIAKHDIENLLEIMETPADTIAPHEFTVTKKQFREFIKKDGFSAGETFVKLKKNAIILK